MNAYETVFLIGVLVLVVAFVIWNEIDRRKP